LPTGKADAVLRKGICLCPEGRHIFPRLTVLENFDQRRFSPPGQFVARRSSTKIYNYFPLLAERAKQLGGTLSGGEQQMLAPDLRAKRYATAVDEPSASPQIVARILKSSNASNEKGVPPSCLRRSPTRESSCRFRRASPRYDWPGGENRR